MWKYVFYAYPKETTFWRLFSYCIRYSLDLMTGRLPDNNLFGTTVVGGVADSIRQASDHYIWYTFGFKKNSQSSNQDCSDLPFGNWGVISIRLSSPPFLISPLLYLNVFTILTINFWICGNDAFWPQDDSFCLVRGVLPNLIKKKLYKRKHIF